MARDSLTANMLTAMNSPAARHVRLAQLRYSGGTQYLTDNGWDIDYDGNTYQADGSLLGVGDVAEEAELKVSTVKLALSGANLANVSAALNNDTRGRLCLIYFGLIDDDNQVIVDPFNAFRGRFEQFEITEQDRDSKISWKLRNEFADFKRAGGRRTNDTEQQLHFAGDRGFEFASATSKVIYWGIAGTQPPPVLEGGSGNSVVDQIIDLF